MDRCKNVRLFNCSVGVAAAAAMSKIWVDGENNTGIEMTSSE